jgi:hypothetical protein
VPQQKRETSSMVAQQSPSRLLHSGWFEHEGSTVGRKLGLELGAAVGAVGFEEGADDGTDEGSDDGVDVGSAEGPVLGVDEEMSSGWPGRVLSTGVDEGAAEVGALATGVPEGVPEEVPEGVLEEVPEGAPERVTEGVTEAVSAGVTEGVPEAVTEGVSEGVLITGLSEGTMDGGSDPTVGASDAAGEVSSEGLADKKDGAPEGASVVSVGALEA